MSFLEKCALILNTEIGILRLRSKVRYLYGFKWMLNCELEAHLEKARKHLFYCMLHPLNPISQRVVLSISDICYCVEIAINEMYDLDVKKIKEEYHVQ